MLEKLTFWKLCRKCLMKGIKNKEFQLFIKNVKHTGIITLIFLLELLQRIMLI